MADILENGTVCDAVLATASVTKIHESLSLKLAWLRVVDESNYEKYKRDFAASVPGYFDGNYNQFAEKRNKLFISENYDLTISSARDVLMTFVSAEAIAAWSDCIAVNHAGLHRWIRIVSDETSVVTIRWSPPAGLGPLRKTELAVVGGQIISDNFSPNEAFLGQVDVLIKRDTPHVAVTGIASGLAGPDPGGAWSTSFHIPRKPAPIDKPVAIDLDYGNGYRHEFTTPQWIGDAILDVSIQITAKWEEARYHWLQLTVWLDGILHHWSGEIEINEGESKTIATKFRLHIPAGITRKIIIQHDNNGAKAQSMLLRLHGSYKGVE